MGRLAARARGALGLRGRIVGVVLFTAVATLAVAAVALLSPLENSLRNAEIKTLKGEITGKTIDRFRALPLGQILADHGEPGGPIAQLHAAQNRLQGRVGGPVTVLTRPVGLGGRPTGLLAGINGAGGGDDDTDDDFGDAVSAFRTDRRSFTLGIIDGTEYARAAIPFAKTIDARRAHGRPVPGTGIRVRYVLAVRKSIAEIPDVVRVVRRAFFDAALAGLALTLLLGIPLSARLVRRLRALRVAAVAVALDPPGAVVPVDTARDEVGSLSRALVAMQQRLRRQEQARRQFVATASHELRTPLTSLDGMLELLDEDLHDGQPDLDDARELLGRARAQSRRLGRLAADLLDLSRIDAQVQLRSEAVELAEVSRAVLAEFELGNAERGIHSGLDASGESVWALGDPGSIARILRILLDNAQRASPPGSEIRVRVRGGERGTISVCDEGAGVPEDERVAIFERFSRGRDTAGEAGFGLGLAIGRELAGRMGGDLVLEPASQPGATFTLQLPAALAPEQDPLPVA